MIGLQELKLVS